MTVKLITNCLKCSLLLIFLLFLQTTQAQNFSGIEAILKQNQKLLGKDVVVIVSKDGKNLYQKETEEFRIKNPAPVYHSSKCLTAAVVMAFVDAGKISLDDKVSKYLPIFDNYFKGYITIRQCLSHTTGIQEAQGIAKVAQRSKFASLEEEVNAFASKREIADNAGTAFFYSNIGPNIAARVIEVVSKKSFDRVAQEKIFRPCGMRSTTFYSEKGSVDPADGATSTAQDMINFMTMILNKGKIKDKQILSEQSIREMQTFQFPAVPNKFTPKTMQGFEPGMGLWIEQKDNSGKPSIVSSPGILSAWPWIDYSRNYVAVVFPANGGSEEKRQIVEQIRSEIEKNLK